MGLGFRVVHVLEVKGVEAENGVGKLGVTGAA